MLVVLVVPAHVPGHERARVFDGVERAGVVRPILHCAELGLGVRVVVGYPWPVVSLGDAQVGEVVLQRRRAHRGSGVGVHDVGEPFVGDRAGEHLDREIVDLTVLHSPADELAGVDVDDRVRLERASAPGGAQIGDVPRPDLPRTGRFQHRRLPRRAGAAAPSGRDGPGGLVLDRHGDPPPRAAGAEHHAFIPRGRERVIHRDPVGPAGGDPPLDLSAVGLADP